MFCTNCGEPIYIGGDGCLCIRARNAKIKRKQLEEKCKDLVNNLFEIPSVASALLSFGLDYGMKAQAKNELKTIIVRVLGGNVLSDADSAYVWSFVYDVEAERPKTMGPVEARHTREMIRELVEKTQGWWVANDKGLMEFIDLDDWTARLNNINGNTKEEGNHEETVDNAGARKGKETFSD